MASTRKRLEALTAGLTLPERPKESVAQQDSVPASAVIPSAAVAVETRFPPAVGGPIAPRTAPGQMMAFRGRMQQVEGEMAALRDKLKQYEGSLPTRKMDPSTIQPSRWANRHESSFMSSDFASLKADMGQAGGNVQPILVRPLQGKADRFELVFGHRRHRAALELGIPVLASVWVEELGDAALFAAMDRENRERADLSPYEQGVMYQRALEEQLFPTQRQLAEGLGVSHTWVRKALMVAQLPPAVVECFRSPLEISFRHAEQINTVMDQDRRAFLKRVEKLRGQSLAPSVVVAKLLDRKPGYDRPQKLEIQAAGQKLGTLIRSKSGEITVTISPDAGTGAEVESLAAAIAEAVRRVRGLE